MKLVFQCKEILDCEDVLIEIFLELPLKDVLRLKCVSNQYRRIISDPLFGYLYYKNNPVTHSLSGFLLYHSCWPFNSRHNFVYLDQPHNLPRNPFGSLIDFDENSGIHRIWSCNGLFCLWLARHKIATCDFYICNPTTYKSIKLPNLSRPSNSRILSMNIAFDPKMSPFYKVVCVWVHVQNYCFSVYSSESKMWRHTNASLDVKLNDTYLFKKGVFWNNSLHWISRNGPFLRFEIDNECFGTMPMTEILGKNQAKTRNIQYFGVSNNRLHLVERHNGTDTSLEILELQEDYSRWISKFQIRLSTMFRLPVGLNEHFKMMIHWVLRPHAGNSFGFVVSSSYSTIWICIYNGAVHVKRLRLLHRGMDMSQFKWYRSHQFFKTLTAVWSEIYLYIIDVVGWFYYTDRMIMDWFVLHIEILMYIHSMGLIISFSLVYRNILFWLLFELHINFENGRRDVFERL